ncbi:MAG: TonB-dependent receptor [Halioglobus sp.]
MILKVFPGKLFLRSLVSLSLLLVTPYLLAQNSLTLEEVIVSARKIDETAQTVPISISVLGKEKLSDINAFDFTEIDRIAPSLQLSQSSPASATLKIRNIGPDFFALAFPPAVAVFVDGVPQTQPGSVFSTMLDIERIEVLSGPQGTLYGKNAPAGMIGIYTANPDPAEFAAKLTTSFSSWDTNNNTLAVNVPLIDDKLALRVAGMYAESDGYVDNAIAGVDEGNGKEHKGVRSKLLWAPTEDMEFVLSYYYADLYTEDNATGYEGRVPDNRMLTAFTSSYDQYEVFKGVPSFADTEVEDVVLNVRWALDDVNLSLAAQHQDLNLFQQQDNSDWRVIPPADTPRDSLVFDPTIDSLELRADGEVSERINYVAGIFLSDEQVNTVNSINNINIIGEAETLSQGYFTNWTFKLAEQWDTSLGLRYTDISYDTNVFGFIPGLGELNTPFDTSYDDISYSFKLRYFTADDILFYGAVDTAFRAGGINVLAPLAGELTNIFQFPPVQGNLQTISDDYFEFEQEDSISYEAGVKGLLLDDRLRFSLTFFLQQYDGYQHRTSPTDAAVTEVLAGAFSNLAVNVEELETMGFETELQYLISDNWSIFGTAAYSKPEIKEYSKRMCSEGEAEPGLLICPGEKGEQLNDEPTFHGFLQLTYQRAILEGRYEFFALTNADYYDKPYQAVSTPNIEDILTFDLTLGLRDPDGVWSLKVWSKNLTDEMVIFSEGVVTENVFEPGGALISSETVGFSASPRAPRSFGVTLDVAI